MSTWRPPGGPPIDPASLTPAGRAIVDAMQMHGRDPFQGTRARHVIADDTPIVEMEAAAALAALEQAGTSRDEIDLLLTCTTPVDYALTNSACALHERLGLPRACFSLHVEGAQHGFLLQLSLAQAMIATGQARRALLVQASAASRIADPRTPISAVFGDGATAVVLGPVSGDRGILGSSHRTDGRLPNTLIASVIGKRWYDEGRPYLHLADPVGMRDILLRTVDLTVEGIHAALAAADLAPERVDVFAMHQGMPWLRSLVQEHAGLSHTRGVDTYVDTGHLFAAFVPSTLVAAQREGILADDQVVLIAGGGNGMTFGAAVLRWGA
ncbi:MAG: 3-oxoacyl-ACP synthase III family protein [Kofleriaceae bacterium]